MYYRVKLMIWGGSTLELTEERGGWQPRSN